MPNQTDWNLLKKTINGYKENIVKIWGNITQDNAHIISTYKYNDKDLFEFLLSNEHFSDANTIASCISLFNETYIQKVYEKHHDCYYNILKILCIDKMIILYEEYHDKVHNENKELTSEIINTEQKMDFNDMYRIAISKRYEYMIIDKEPSNNIIELINEFKFLTHPYLEDFYNFSLNIKNIEIINKFNDLYKKYMEFVPLIYRLINEYYLEYIKYQLKIIEDTYGNSFIIVSEYYDHLKTCISSLPRNYVDYRYQDKMGNNIVFYLCSLPFLSEQINREIYQSFFKQNPDIPLNLKNIDDNTIFHIIANYENQIFLEELLNYFFKSKENDHLSKQYYNKNDQINKISELFMIKNIFGETMFDILLKKNNFVILVKIIDFLPPKIYSTLTNELIKNFEIFDKIPNTDKLSQIYIAGINYYMENILNMKKDIFYDLCIYSDNKTKILKLLEKCPDEINMNQLHYLEWLFICIKINEYELFKIILAKFFSNEKNINTTKYLNKIIPENNEPIIISAIKEQKILFIKSLFKYDIDLFICDEINRNAIIVALDTKNLYLIRMIRNHILGIPKYFGMIQIMNNFIDLLDRHEMFNVFSIYDTLLKLWKSVEYMINYIIYSVTTFSEKE